MLKVLAFYIFIWWFVKLENKKYIIIRIVTASIFAILFYMSGIVLSTDENIVRDGFTFVGIFSLIVAIMFTVRIVLDSVKLKKIIGNKNMKK